VKLLTQVLLLENGLLGVEPCADVIVGGGGAARPAHGSIWEWE